MVMNSQHVSVEARLDAYARQWTVALDEVRATETSLLGFGARGSQPVVLKVIRRENSEEWHCGEVLEAFRGEGVIRPLDYSPGAVLLPRLQPGYDLASLTQSNGRLLHGDLHHFNVLFDQREGWVVIDPWGVNGELEFEIGPSLRNPVPHVVGARRLERRLRIYESRLKMDATRALKWAFATTVLALLWPCDPKFGQDLRRPFASAADSMWQLIGERT